MNRRYLLWIIVDRLRRSFVQFKLGAHFLKASSESFNLLLLVRKLRLKFLLLLRGSCLEVLPLLHDGRFQFPHFAVLFEELV